MFQQLLEAEAVSMLDLERTTPRQIQQLLSSSLKGVGFTITVEDPLGLDWSTVDIVSKELSVLFSRCDSEVHVDVICFFIRRLNELGDCAKLEIALYQEYDIVMPKRVTEELNHALAANQSMVELCIRGAFSHFDERLADIFATMEQHKGLRRLKVDFLPQNPGCALLKRLLKRNRHIEVTNCNGDRITNGFEIDRLYEFNWFVRNCQGLTHEPLSLLPLFVGEVLTHSASGDLQRSALLMANHTDALCELLLYSSMFSSEVHMFDAAEELADTNHAATSQCEPGSLHSDP